MAKSSEPVKSIQNPDQNPGLIGKAIRIKGKLRGKEDLVIEGKVEGTISLEQNHLTIERSAVIHADVEVQNVTIKGEVYGNSSALDKVEISEAAKVMGDIKAPRIVMHEGAKFKGAVEMDVLLPEGIKPEPKPEPVQPEVAPAYSADPYDTGQPAYSADHYDTGQPAYPADSDETSRPAYSLDTDDGWK